MSLLTDRDYLLHSLQLAYIRHVLPNHAPNSSRSGTGPYNLISFPVHSQPGADPSLSPYVALSGLADQHAWPELASGRNSPPLGLTLARERSTGSPAGTDRGNASGDAPGRTRRGGPGLLGYTQTIVGKGSGVGGAGMRVGGKQRSWKGKGKMVIPENDDDQAEGGPQELTTEALERRDSFENNLHQRRLARQPSNLVPPLPGALVPPPVVIHSPVRTPRDSPTSPTRPMTPSAGPSLADLHASPPHPPPSDLTATAAAATERRPRFAAATTEYHPYHSASHSPSRASSASDFPSRPLSQLTEASSQGADAGPSAPASPLSLSHSPSPSPEAPPPLSLSQAGLPSEPHSLPQHPDTSTSLTSSSPLRSSSPSPTPSLSSSAPQDSEPPQTLASSDFPAGPISMASSGVSLFGTSRHDRSAGLGGGGDETDPEVSKARERSDSEGSPALAPPLPPPPAAPAPVVPAFKLPPGIRVRERRRVNIRPGAGGMLLPPSLVAAAKAGAEGLGSIKEPERGEEHDHEHEHEHEELEVKNEKKEDEQEDEHQHGVLEVGNEKKEGREEVKQEDGPPKADSGASTTAGRTRSNTDPMLSRPSAVAGEEAASTAGEEGARPGIGARHQSEGSTPQTSPRSRKVSAPPTVPSGALQPQTQPGIGKEQHLAPPPPSPRRREDSSPALVFPKRSAYILSPPSPTPLSPPQRSALTALLTGPASLTSSSNPFSTLYASCVSRSTSSSDTLTLTLYFPHCTKPGASKPLTVGVKRDVTVEEVIGVGLWAYWEGQEKGEREPKIEVEEDKAESGEETTKWNLRIVEEDGEVDEDFPALDRVRAISAFSFNEFAIVKATDQQSKDNAAKQATITRRPSRILSAPKRGPPAPVAATTGATLAPPQPADVPFAQLADSFRPGSTAVGTMGVSSPLAVPVLLKVQLPPAPGISVNTTVQVPSDMYLVDVL
ncbi:hypothetical protein JCM5296_000191, partial [Sporobolomyces johnsonii]